MSLLEALADGQRSLADVLGLAPQLLEQLVDKALALSKFGKHDEAARLLADLSVVDARSAMLPFLLGTVRATADDHVGAVTAYGEALNRDAEEKPSPQFRAEVHLLRAKSSLAIADVRTAREDLEFAASFDIAGASETARTLLGAIEERDADS